MIPKMIPNPAWTASDDARLQREATKDRLARQGQPFEDVFPEDYDKDLPETGCWIMLLTDIRVGKQTGATEESVKLINVPRLSLWYAMPHTSNCRVMLAELGNGTGRRVKQRDRDFAYLRQAVINTPDGAVHVWPREYQKVDINKFLEFSDQDGLQIHYLNEDSGIDDCALFYLRSRGIDKAEAQKMLLGQLANPNFCYFTFVPEITRQFNDGAGMPYLMPINHQRRAASRKRRNIHP